MLGINRSPDQKSPSDKSTVNTSKCRNEVCAWHSSGSRLHPVKQSQNDEHWAVVRLASWRRHRIHTRSSRRTYSTNSGILCNKIMLCLYFCPSGKISHVHPPPNSAYTNIARRLSSSVTSQHLHLHTLIKL